MTHGQSQKGVGSRVGSRGVGSREMAGVDGSSGGKIETTVLEQQ